MRFLKSIILACGLTLSVGAPMALAYPVTVTSTVELAQAEPPVAFAPLAADDDAGPADAGVADAGPDAGPAYPDASADPAGWAAAAYKAISGGNAALGVAILLAGLLVLARKYGARWVPSLQSPEAAAGVAVALGVLGALINALAVPGMLSWAVLGDGLRVGLLAAIPFFKAMTPKTKPPA